jgi:pimeloyl-ACP methyl ester carboxylesterase
MLLHGWDSRGSHMGAFVAPLLEAGFRVVTLDALSHGDSEGDRSSVTHHAQSALQVAHAAGGIHLVVGHSVGSLAALLAMNQGLAVKGSVHLAGPSSMWRVAQAAAPALGLKAEEFAAFANGVAAFAGLPLRAADAVALSRSQTTPALLVYDPADAEIPFAESELLARSWPQANLVPMPDVGHRKILRAPQAVQWAVAFAKSMLAQRPATAS